jgi:hypothetical protein
MMSRAQQCDRKNGNLRTRRQSPGDRSCRKRPVPAGRVGFPLRPQIPVASDTRSRSRYRDTLVLQLIGILATP